MNHESTPTNKHEMADGRLTVGELSRRLEQERSGSGRHAAPEYSVQDEFNKAQEAMDAAVERHDPANKDFQDEMDAFDATFAKYGVSESTGKHAASESTGRHAAPENTGRHAAPAYTEGVVTGKHAAPEVPGRHAAPENNDVNTEALASEAIAAEENANVVDGELRTAVENDSVDNTEERIESGEAPADDTDSYQDPLDDLPQRTDKENNVSDEQIEKAMTEAKDAEDTQEEDKEPRNYKDLVRQAQAQYEQEQAAKSDEELAAAMLEASHDAEKSDDDIANAMLEVFREANAIEDEPESPDDGEDGGEYDDDYEDGEDEVERQELVESTENQKLREEYERRHNFYERGRLETIRLKQEALKRKADRRTFKEAFLAGVGGASEAIKNGTLKTARFFGNLLSKFKRKKELSSAEVQEAQEELKENKVQYSDGAISLKVDGDGEQLVVGPYSTHKYAKNILKGGNDVVVIRAETGDTDDNGQPIINEYGLVDGYIMNLNTKKTYDIRADESTFTLDIGKSADLPSIGKVGKILNVEMRWKSAGSGTYDGATQSNAKSPFTKYVNGAQSANELLRR